MFRILLEKKGIVYWTPLQTLIHMQVAIKAIGMSEGKECFQSIVEEKRGRDGKEC